MSNFLLLFGLVLFIIIANQKLFQMLEYAHGSIKLYLSVLLFSLFLVAVGLCVFYIQGNIQNHSALSLLSMTVIVFSIGNGIKFVAKSSIAIFNKLYFVSLKTDQFFYYKKRWNNCLTAEARTEFINQLTPDDLVAILGDYFIHTQKYRLIASSMLLKQGIVYGEGKYINEKSKVEFVLLPTEFKASDVSLKLQKAKLLVLVNPNEFHPSIHFDKSRVCYIHREELEKIFSNHFHTENRFR